MSAVDLIAQLERKESSTSNTLLALAHDIERASWTSTVQRPWLPCRRPLQYPGLMCPHSQGRRQRVCQPGQ